MSRSRVDPPFGGLFVGLLVLLLAGCAAMPVTSMVKLARTDFTTVDPASLRVALKLPEGVRPRPRGVRLRLTGTVDGAKETQEFVLADLADPGEFVSLRGEVSKGTAVYAFRLEPADVPRLVAWRADLLARKARGGHGSLTLGVAADGCRTGPLPATILLTTYLRTEPGGDFFPLARDIDLRKVAGQAVAAELPPCG
jgi:hypothetical protein